MGVKPRNRSDRRRNNSNVISNKTETVTRTVAAAKIVGLICSLRPVNICHGNVFSPGAPRKITTTTSSKDVMKAKSPPPPHREGSAASAP
jgi:hypothetical protein